MKAREDRFVDDNKNGEIRWMDLIIWIIHRRTILNKWMYNHQSNLVICNTLQTNRIVI
jgi:hypothetical protein